MGTTKFAMTGLRILIALALAGVLPAHAKHTCSAREADAADAQVDHLASWDAVNAAFIQYRHCDTGEIAEGNSEAVARLLVDHWSTLPRLGVLIGHNPSLGAFVLRHIDSTLDTDDLEKISALARSSCPVGMKPFCRDLAAAASRAAR